MKTRLTSIALFLLTFTVMSQETRFFDSLDQAKSVSVKSKIPLLIYFSGSDWCKPCINMKKEVLMSPEFAKYSTEISIYIADFPYRKKQEKGLKKTNEALAEKYNSKGIFPNLVLLNPSGDKLYETSYKKQSPAELISELKSKY